MAKVAEKDFVSDQAETWVGLPSNTVDDYQFIMWAHAIRTRANRTARHQYRQHAVTGYYLNENDEWTMRTVPWRYLFQGGTHAHWWPGGYAFTADLSEPMLCLQQAAEECRELERGGGKLLISSRKRLDPILILWSNTSYYAGILNPGEISWEAARKRFENLLRHTGLDYRLRGVSFQLAVESGIASWKLTPLVSRTVLTPGRGPGTAARRTRN